MADLDGGRTECGCQGTLGKKVTREIIAMMSLEVCSCFSGCYGGVGDWTSHLLAARLRVSGRLAVSLHHLYVAKHTWQMGDYERSLVSIYREHDQEKRKFLVAVVMRGCRFRACGKRLCRLGVGGQSVFAGVGRRDDSEPRSPGATQTCHT